MTTLSDSISKDFGANIILNGNAIMDKEGLTIPVSPAMDIILNGGIPEGSFVVFTGQPKCGKSLENSAKIYTPSGPSTMGQMRVGQEVCTPSGKSSRVIGVYPQGYQDIYRVYFNDGSIANCTLDHNWTVSKNNRQTKYITMTLEQIMKEGLEYSDRKKWKIALTKPTYFKQQKPLKTDPYILGCLIGDGGLTNRQAIITSSDDSIVRSFKNFAKKLGLHLKQKSKYDYAITGGTGNRTNLATRQLKELKLMGHSSHTKFIPEHYKYSSVNNRFKLIKGLMDTDGSNDNGLRAEYTTVSKILAEDVREVLQSLGYTATIVARSTTHSTAKGKRFPSYRLYIHGNDIDKLFSLPRKISGHIRTKPPLFRTIVDIKKSHKAKAQCIEIEDKEGLYLTDQFIVTHNTTTSLDFAATAQKPEYSKGAPRNVYYLNIEGRLKKRDLEGIPGINLDKFHIIGSQQGKILHAEEYLQIGERIINEDPGCLLIIDSYSALCTEAEITSDMDKMQRADGAKLLAKFCRKVANVIPVNKNIVIGITHLMGNPTGYGAEFKEKSGQAIAYQTDVKIRAKTFKPWLLSSDNSQIGQEVEWQTLCSALGPPGGVITSYIRYGQGIDKQMELINLSVDLGLINKGGAWYSLKVLNEEKKFQGTEKLRQFMMDNPQVYTDMYSEVKKTMGIK